MTATGASLPIRIVGHDGPARACPGSDGIALGIQRGSDVVDAVPSSSDEIRFDAEVEVLDRGDALDFRGPYVHGPKGGRFLYLAWVETAGSAMVARIKLQFGDIDPGLIDRAIRDGAVLVATLPLTRPNGKPATGSVRPPLVSWELETLAREAV